MTRQVRGRRRGRLSPDSLQLFGMTKVEVPRVRAGAKKSKMTSEHGKEQSC